MSESETRLFPHVFRRNFVTLFWECSCGRRILEEFLYRIGLLGS